MWVPVDGSQLERILQRCALEPQKVLEGAADALEHLEKDGGHVAVRPFRLGPIYPCARRAGAWGNSCD